MAENKKLDFQVFKRLFSYTKPHRGIFIISLIAALIVAFLGPYRAHIIGQMVNDQIVNFQDEEGLKNWSLILVLILTVEIFFQFISQYLSNLLGQKIIYNIRVSTFDRILNFNSKYFDKTPVGSLVTRVVSDIEAIADVFSQGIFSILTESLKIILVFVLMFSINWKFGLLVVIPIPILFIATRIFANAMKKANQKERTQVNRLNTFVQERLNAINLIKIFSREKEEFDQFKDINTDHRAAHINAVWAFSIFLPVVEILSSLSIAFLILWGVLMFNYEPENTGLLFGQIFSYILWIHMLYRPIRQLADRFNTIQRGVVRAERVFAVLDTKAEITKEGNKPMPEGQLGIQFKNVDFSYVEGNKVFKNLSLSIEKGQKVAIVGATGSGKTSIINLIPRFYEFQKGEILINNTNIKDFEVSSLREKIGIVLQDVFLFSDSLYNNVIMGDTKISKEDVLDAADKIGIVQLIKNLPGGLDYNVGERGGVLSVGQRQLISFLRAYLKGPELLILDEATANIDVESEELIKKATEHLTQNRTSIIIAHRLSTIKNADKIIVLDQGEILEQGTHDELLNQNGVYKNLFEVQFKELEDE